MLFREWEILLVDDEPDVLTISKLAMRNFKVYGLPIRIYTARSKLDAIELLHHKPSSLWGIAVAFIDVVMESDVAGLELCQYIRQDMDNHQTQLIIRTGQPGLAPERAIIDEYDINGYFTKVDTTEEKLYSLVKSSVRQFVISTMYERSVLLLDEVIVNSREPDKLKVNVQQAFTQFIERDRNSRYDKVRSFLSVDNKAWLCTGIEEGEANNLVAALKQRGVSLNKEGILYARDDNHNQLIHIEPDTSRSEVNFLFRTPFLPPSHLVEMTGRVFQDIGVIWHLAK